MKLGELAQKETGKNLFKFERVY